MGAGLDRSQVVPTSPVEQATSATSSSSGLNLDTNVPSGNSTVQNSPILSKLNSLDSSKFNVFDSSNIEVPTTNTNMPADNSIVRNIYSYTALNKASISSIRFKYTSSNTRTVELIPNNTVIQSFFKSYSL